MKKTIYCLVALVLLVSLLLGGCATKPAPAPAPAPKPAPSPTPAPTPAPAPAPAPQVSEITVIDNDSMSGAGAMWGIAFSNTRKVYIDGWNKEGGILVGGKRYTIKHIIYDNKRDPATSLDNTKKAIFVDKATVVFHHGGTAVTPCLPVLAENKIPSFDISVGPQVLKYPYNFNMLPAGRNWSLAGWQGFKKLFNIKTAAEINPDNESGYTTEIDDRWAAKQAGVSIINHQFFPDDTTDFYPILTKAIATKPDILVMGLGSPGHLPLFIKQARELGWTGPMGMTQGSVGDVGNIVKMAGKGAEGFTYPNSAHGDPNFFTDQEKAFVAKWLAFTKEPAFIPDCTHAVRQTESWLQAVQKAGSFDAEKVAAALESLEVSANGWKFKFVVTPDTFMGKPRSALVPMALQQIKDGKAAVVDMIIPEGVSKVQ